MEETARDASPVKFKPGDKIELNQLSAAVRQGVGIPVVMVQDDGIEVAFDLTIAVVDAQGNFGGQGPVYYEMTSWPALTGTGKQFIRAVNANGVFVDIPKGEIRASTMLFFAR